MATSEFTIDDLMDLLVEKVGLPPAERTEDPASHLRRHRAGLARVPAAAAQLDTRYGVELPDDRPQAFTVGEIIAVVNDHVAKQGAA